MIPLERFWGEEEAEFDLSDGGFLVDPKSDFPLANLNLRALESYDDYPCLILLGEMGSGKSSELNRFACTPSNSPAEKLLFDLGAYDGNTLEEIFHDPRIQKWNESDKTLYLLLDSFDEALLEVKVLADRLYRGLAGLQRNRLRLRIVCRSGIWPSTAEKKFREIWSEVKVLRLAPLRRRDARELASADGVLATDQFLKRIATAKATPFASRPGTLKFLVKTYLSNRTLPDSEIRLYDEGCRLICSEQPERLDRGHGGHLVPEERMTIAGRIATLMLCSAKSHLFTGANLTALRSTDLGLDEVVRGFESLHETSVSLNRDHLKDVASSGLFRPIDSDRVAWFHHSYAEHLAARHMIERLSADQIVGLLGNVSRHETKVVPQLSGVAARAASLLPGVFDALVQSNPDTHLLADSLALTAKSRSALVASLLDALENGDI